ncbi:MAG: hypothetical protein QJR05_14570, partial [Thermoanaerobacterium sp.]|nr:hypothetical protein [Thermoanaerobacterium sp.]
FADQNVMQKDSSAINVKEDNLKETDKINMIERIKANEIFPSEGILQKLSTESNSIDDSTITPNGVGNTYYNYTTGGPNNNMYVDIEATNTGNPDLWSWHWDGQSFARDYTYPDADELTHSITLTAVGISPSVSLEGISASGATTASATYTNVLHSTFHSEIYFEDARVSEMGLISTTFTAKLSSVHGTTSYNIETHVTSWS